MYSTQQSLHNITQCVCMHVCYVKKAIQSDYQASNIDRNMRKWLPAPPLIISQHKSVAFGQMCEEKNGYRAGADSTSAHVHGHVS